LTGHRARTAYPRQGTRQGPRRGPARNLRSGLLGLLA